MTLYLKTGLTGRQGLLCLIGFVIPQPLCGCGTVLCCENFTRGSTSQLLKSLPESIEIQIVKHLVSVDRCENVKAKLLSENLCNVCRDDVSQYLTAQVKATDQFADKHLKNP
jgi:hypothetical protein